MIRVFVLAAAIIVCLVHRGDGVGASAQAGAHADELARIENRLVKSWIAGDRAAVDSILAADWSVIDLTGRVLTKEQVLREFGSGDRKIESGAVDDLSFRVFGDFAVVTGRSMLSGSYQGKKVSVVQRFTDVFARRDGRWQAIASQGTQVAK